MDEIDSRKLLIGVTLVAAGIVVISIGLAIGGAAGAVVTSAAIAA